MLLEINNLTKIYGRVIALDGFSYSADKGKIVGLLGPNGSGKTSLIKILAGILQPSDGQVKIDDKEVGVETKSIVSYLPERSYINPRYTVKEAIEFFKLFYNDFNEAEAYNLISILNVNPTRRFGTLSKGMREKVQLALVMSRNAKLYLLDEPIGGVDVSTRDFIVNYILKNYNRNGTIIISTHLIYDIEDILDEFILMNNGTVISSGNVKELKERTGGTLDGYVREMFRCY